MRLENYVPQPATVWVRNIQKDHTQFLHNQQLLGLPNLAILFWAHKAAFLTLKFFEKIF